MNTACASPPPTWRRHAPRCDRAGQRAEHAGAGRRAQGDLGEARRDEKRKQDLLAQNFISSAELDTAKSKAASLAEALKVAQAQVEVSARAGAERPGDRAPARGAAAVGARGPAAHADPLAGQRHRHQAQRRGRQTVAASLQAPELFIIARSLSDMQVEASIDEATSRACATARRSASPSTPSRPPVRGRGRPGAQGRGVGAERGVLHRGGGLRQPRLADAARHDRQRAHRHRHARERAQVPNAALRVRIAGVGPWRRRLRLPRRPTVRRRCAPAAGGFSLLPEAHARWRAHAALRERLVDGLQLDAAQQAQLDTVLAEMRPEFASLAPSRKTSVPPRARAADGQAARAHQRLP